jgi:hypothetical protein
MKRELVEPILEGYTALLRELLDSDDKLRFNRIVRIAKMAHELQQQVAICVAAIDDGRAPGPGGLLHIDNDPEGEFLEGGIRNLGIRNIHQPRIESTDIIREMVGAFQPIAQMYMAREKEARLRQLCLVRADLEKAGKDASTIEARIDTLLGDMKEKKNADQRVVHTELLRGHQGGGGGAPELQGHHVEPDHGRAEGARAASQDGDEKGLAGGGRGSGVAGDDDDRCADRQGLGGHRPGTQA